MTVRLTRRDAVAALAAAGIAVGSGGTVLPSPDEERPEPVGDRELATLVAAAEVLYPGDLEAIDRFVRRYVRGVADDRPGHGAGIADAAAYLDDYARAWHDGRFAALDPATRDEVLWRMGADAVDPDPAGSDVERVRYYVVNELLFALYTSPAGGELLGLDTPPGHPGGLASYQRGPGP